MKGRTSQCDPRVATAKLTMRFFRGVRFLHSLGVVRTGLRPSSRAMAKPAFTLPSIDDNPDGWGPSTLPEQFSDMPYAPFEKRAFLGRMSDWSARAEQARERYRNQNRQPSVTNEAFAQEADDVAGFNL